MKIRSLVLLLLLMILATSLASTCPVCYGETDANTASAVNAAILSLLLVIGAVLSFVVSLAFQIRKRMKLLAMNNLHEPH